MTCNMSDLLSDRNCPTCNGTGRLIDKDFINERITALKIPLQQVARAIGVTPSYLTKMMNGSRRWTPDRVAKFLKKFPQ